MPKRKSVGVGNGGAGASPRKRKAYTKDGVLVYKVMCTNVDYCLNQRAIFKYFGQFGTVSLVQMNRGSNRCTYVTFAKPKDAFAALNHSLHHNILGNMISVRAADSCLQPFSEKMIERMSKVYKGALDPQTSPIFKLNEYCLMHLFKFLSLSDQYKMSRLSERFENVFRTVFRRQHKCIEVNGAESYGGIYGYGSHVGTPVKILGNMTPLEWKEIIKHYGYMVTSLEFFYAEEQMNDCAGCESIHCPNLKSLVIFGFPIDGPFSRLVTKLKTLHTVDISYTGLSRQFANSLAKMASLEALLLNNVTGISGRYFHSFKNLKELSLIEMPIKNVSFRTTVTKCSILDCNHVDEAQAIARFGKNLRELEICTSCDVACIGHLPKLEKLHLHFDSDVDDADFINLIAKLRDKLRVLTLQNARRDSDDVEPQFLTDVQREYIFHLKLLEELVLNDFEDFDEDFLLQMLTLPNLKRFKSVYSYPEVDEDLVEDFIRKSPKLETFEINDHNYCSSRS